MHEFKVYQASGYLTKLVRDASDVRKDYEDISGSLVEFDTPIAAPLSILIVDINPVQDLHGQEYPYPAGGWKNKFNPSAATIGINWNGSEMAYSIASDYISVEVGKSYTISVADMPKYTGVTVAFLDADKNYVTAVNLTTFDVTDGVAFIRISFRCANTDVWTESDLNTAKIQVELGSTATSWSPYENICPITGWDEVNVYHSGEDTSDPTTYTVSWQDDAGTVYGGTIDMVSGVLTVKMASVDIGTLTWTYNSSRKYFNSSYLNNVRIPSTSAIVTDWALSSIYKASAPTQIYGAAESYNNCFAIFQAGYLGISNQSYTDASSFKTDMSGVQLVYELAEPITVQLEPQEINTFIGVNNIWADTGDVSVEYRTH